MLASLLFVSLLPLEASAWQILSAVTDPCHEQLTLSALPGVDGAAFSGDISDIRSSAIFPPSTVQVDPVVSGIADEIADAIGVTVDSAATGLALLSLYAGARYPDVMEGSAYDFFVMRPLMLSDSHESGHCLRRSYDDGPEGDVSAVDDARTLIMYGIGLAVEAARGPLADRFVTHTVFIDFYGEVQVELYEPLVMLGRALHTFEDSFAHTLRSDDLRYIISVFNSIDAVTDHFDEQRDGIAHSMAMDRCMDEALDIAVICAQAVRELVAAVSADVESDSLSRTARVLEYWMSLKPGCTLENNYCNAIWLDTARIDAYEPFIPMFLGCGASDAGSPWPLLLLLIPVVACRLRRNR